MTAIFPCQLRVLSHTPPPAPDGPIVLYVVVEGGICKVGTPLFVPSKGNCEIGTITSIDINGEEIQSVKQGANVCIKLAAGHFDSKDELLFSKLTRESIDACKLYNKDELSKEDWRLVVQIKAYLNID